MTGRTVKTATAMLFATIAALTLGAGAAGAQSGPAVIGGGSGIVLDGKGACTVTTIGNDAQGRLVGLTAGHCGGVGAAITAEQNPGAGRIGTVSYVNNQLDYGIIEFDPGSVVPTRRVGNVTITGIGAAPDFATVACKEGRTTGNTCGITWGDLLDEKVKTWTQMCVVQGDSGSPVVVGTTLVGMVNGYLGVPCLGPEKGTNMTAVMADIDGRGGVGAGFRPI